jgi:hypothetical protein
MPDDAELENRLRELLRDPGWSMRPRPDAPARIRRVVRRQRVRTASFAAGTAAVAAAAIAIPLTVVGGSAPSPEGFSQAGGTIAAGATSPPKYYVDLGPPSGDSGIGPFPEATVLSTATGKAIATVDSPRPYAGFDQVAGAGNSGTFVLSAQQPFSAHRREAFFRLTVSPTGHVRLSPLPVPVTTLPGQLMGIALSPDGNQLALASNGAPPTTRGSFLQVVNLANGTSRQWTWPNVDSEWDWATSQANLAWLNERTIVFQISVGHRPAGWDELSHGAVLETLVLDTAAAGRNLAASRRLPGQQTTSGSNADLTVAPGAGLVMEYDRAIKSPFVSGVRFVRPVVTQGIDEVSAGTGRTVRVLGGGKAVTAFWSSETGTELIVLEVSPAGRDELGIVTADGTFTPLPAPPGVTSNINWQLLYIAW